MACFGVPIAGLKSFRVTQPTQPLEPTVPVDETARRRTRELKTQLSTALRPTPAPRDALVINLDCLTKNDSTREHNGEPQHTDDGGSGSGRAPEVSRRASQRGFFRVQSLARGRGLTWTESRKDFEVLVRHEQDFSKTTAALGSMSDEDRLLERLERLNLDMLLMAGDGNCQFRSISQELYGTQELHLKVRQTVIEHVVSQREQFEMFLGEDFDDYVASMSCPHTWGDELTLRAACDAYGVVVNVVTSDALHWYLTYEPTQVKVDKEVFLTYISPIHYNAIRRKSTLRTISKQLNNSFQRLKGVGASSSNGRNSGHSSPLRNTTNPDTAGPSSPPTLRTSPSAPPPPAQPHNPGAGHHPECNGAAGTSNPLQDPRSHHSHTQLAIRVDGDGLVTNSLGLGATGINGHLGLHPTTTEDRRREGIGEEGEAEVCQSFPDGQRWLPLAATGSNSGTHSPKLRSRMALVDQERETSLPGSPVALADKG